jgi:ligand-binding SRPBCC domain-containing protein
VHTHRFAPTATGGTTLTDHIDWEMPNSMAGRMATPIAKGILEKVFTARQERTKALLEADTTTARM